MGEKKQFRTAGFGGFHRQDVVDYIERTAREHQTRQAELEEQLKAAQTELAERTGKLDDATEKLSMAEQVIATLKAEMDALKNKSVQQQADFEREKQNFAEIELSARRRAAKTEEEARAEAEQIISDAQAEAETLLQQARSDANSQIADLRQQIEQLKEQRRDVFQDARSELNKNATALKANVSISLEEINRLRQTLKELSDSFDGSIRALDAVCVEEA